MLQELCHFDLSARQPSPSQRNPSVLDPARPASANTGALYPVDADNVLLGFFFKVLSH